MYAVHKVLVGVDLICTDVAAQTYELPPPTVEAVELAERIGEYAQAELTFFCVMGESGDASTGAPLDVPGAQGVLDRLSSDASARGVHATARLVSGRAWLEIIREAIREQYDLVLVGSRNHRMRELLLGTTGTKLLRKCPCPVWVARPGFRRSAPTILVADDLTPVGAHCVQLAVSTALMLDARLLIVHAVQYPLESSLRRTGCPPEEIEQYRRKQQDEARQTISDHLEQTDHKTLSHGVAIEVTHGPPDVVILNAIEEHGSDLLIMGTVARSGIPGLLVGNTAERLLPQVECSVIAVKPAGFEPPIAID